MSKNYNKWIFEGHLLADAEMRYIPKGVPVTTFFVAANNQYKNAEGTVVEEVVKYKCQAWNKLAETTAHLCKGTHVLVEGQPVADQSADAAKRGRPKIWTGQDGLPRADYECRILEVRFLSPAKTSAPIPQDQTAPEGDIPF